MHEPRRQRLEGQLSLTRARRDAHVDRLQALRDRIQAQERRLAACTRRLCELEAGRRAQRQEARARLATAVHGKRALTDSLARESAAHERALQVLCTRWCGKLSILVLQI